MKKLTRSQADHLACKFEKAMARIASTHPAETRLLRNVVGALRGGYVRGRHLSQAYQVVRATR